MVPFCILTELQSCIESILSYRWRLTNAPKGENWSGLCKQNDVHSQSSRMSEMFCEVWLRDELKWIEEMIIALCWTIWAIFSHVHLKNPTCLRRDSNPLPMGSCVPVKGMTSDWNVLWSVARQSQRLSQRCTWKISMAHNFVLFLGTHEPHKLTCPHLSGFIAQLVRALHWHCRGHGLESRAGLFESRLTLTQD